MAEQQFDIFAELEEVNSEVSIHQTKELTLNDKATLIVNTLTTGVVKKDWVLSFSISGGKDSMTMMSLGLFAMRKAAEQMKGMSTLRMHIVSSNTLMENIVKEDYLCKEFDDAVEYGKAYGFEVIVHRPRPDRTTSFLRIFAGSKPDPSPSISNKEKQCANDYKIKPIHKAMRSINSNAKAANKRLIMLVGSRTEESTRRAGSLESLSASAVNPIELKGYETLYPIMEWTLDDIWGYINWCEDNINAKLPGHKNGLHAVAELYSSLNGGECVAGLEQSATSCGARDGCHQCTIVMKDKSGINQANSKELSHLRRTLKGILALRDYRSELGKNFQNRNFVSMKDVDGNIQLKPGGYCGWLLEENLRITLTLQVLEKQRADALLKGINKIESKINDGTIFNKRRAEKWLKKVKPHAKILFNLVDESDLIWLDFQWSLRGVTRQAHSALTIWDEVVNKGNLCDIPDEYTCRPPNISSNISRMILSKPQDATMPHDIDFTGSGSELNDPLLDFFDTGKCTEQITSILNEKGETLNTEQFEIEKKYDVNDGVAKFICDNPELLLSKLKYDPKAGCITFINGEQIWKPYHQNQSEYEKGNYDTRHQSAIRSLLRLGVLVVNKSQLKDINRRMEILHFTAKNGLQELSYVGGQASPDEFPTANFQFGEVIQIGSLF